MDSVKDDISRFLHPKASKQFFLLQKYPYGKSITASCLVLLIAIIAICVCLQGYFNNIMSTGWDHLEKSGVKLPEKLKDDEYRETLKTVFTNDGKLHFFGQKGVDPTNPNWHETTLVGSFLSTFDLTKKQWLPLKNVAPLDQDPKHRDFIFAVEDQIFLFIYSKCGGYQKLFQWQNDSWASEIKIDGSCCASVKCSETTEDLEFRFLRTTDGFYAVYEHGPMAHIMRFVVDLGSSGRTMGAKCTEVAKWRMFESFPTGGHVTAMAFSVDHRKIFLWGGQQMCGFWWQPEKVHGAQLEPGKVVEIKPLLDVTINVKPPYAFGGPYRTVQWQNTLIMLGGSSAMGMSQTKDNPEIWAFDLLKSQFRKLNISMPTDFPLYRCSYAVDYAKGDVYVCDKLKGIYKCNVKNL